MNGSVDEREEIVLHKEEGLVEVEGLLRNGRGQSSKD